MVTDASTHTLLSFGGIGEVSPQNDKALRIATENDCIADVKALIESGINPNATDKVCC